MASGSSSDAAESAEPAEPAAAPAAAETEENQVKRRRLQCLGFALVGSCDTTTAPTLLSENNWQTQVSSFLASIALPRWAERALHPCPFAFQKALSAYFEQPENDLACPRQPPMSFKSEA